MNAHAIALFLPFVSAFNYYAPEVAERFPLSGGLTSGLEVEIRVQGYNVSEAGFETSRLEFVTPAGDVSFKFMLNGPKQEIWRTTSGEPMTQKGGGWPLGNTSSNHTFTFRASNAGRGGKRLLTYIDGEYMPWFNSYIIESAVITHLWVFSGMQGVDVTVRQTTCQMGCSTDECVDRWGRNLCKDANGTELDASSCRSSVMQQGLPISCSQSLPVRGTSSECCLGTARPLDESEFPSKQGGVPQRRWVQVVHDEARIRKMCSAFAKFGEICSMKPGSIWYADNVENAMCKIAFPPPTVTPSSTLVTRNGTLILPLSLFKYATIRTYNYTLSSEEMKALPITWDRGSWYDLIADSATRGLGGLYPVMMHERGEENIALPWVPVIEQRYKFWRDFKEPTRRLGVSLLVSSIPEPMDLSCADLLLSSDASWADQQGNDCGNYTQNEWCTKEGHATQQFLDDHPNLAKPDATYPLWDDTVKNEDWGASKPCCSCGGGSFGGERYTFPGDIKNKLNVQDK